MGQKKSCLHVLDVCGEENIIGSLDFIFRWRTRERNRIKSKRASGWGDQRGTPNAFLTVSLAYRCVYKFSSRDSAFTATYVVSWLKLANRSSEVESPAS